MPYAAALFREEMKISTMKIGTDMKYNYLILALATAALCSCSGNLVETPVNDGEIITIRAYQEGATETRTTLIDGGTQVYWEPSDEIKVFFNGVGGRFLAQNTENASVATFTGTLPVVVGGNEGAGISTKTWGLYPYRADAQLDGDAMVTTLPDSQTGRAGSFAKNTNITLAQSDNYGLAFYNVCGGIRFSLTTEGVKEVIFQGQNDENIAGKVKIAFADGVPAIQEVVEGQTSITLSAPNGGTFETGKWYYIVALPGTLANGFKMTFNTDTQYATLKSSGSKTIKRGIFGSLADADEGLIYKDKEGGDTPNPDDVIQFEDPIAKYACVNKFDSNGDGEISYSEAAAVTSLANLFTDWNTVTSFEEIRYFTSVTSTEDVFSGLTKLKHITIPNNITTLGTFKNCTALEAIILPASLASLPSYCFDGCKSLISVTLPTGITSIPDYAFRNCSVLETISVPSTIKSVGQYAFSGCTVLTDIDLPSGFQTIGAYAFQNCQAMASVDFPATLTSIGNYAYSGCTALTAVAIGNGVSVGQYAFSGCSSLVSVVLPENMSTIPAYCFQNCTGLATITWPSAPTTIGNYAFAGCRFKDSGYALQLPASVTSIGSNAFGALRHLIMPSTTPISIASDSFLVGYTVLYVPAGMVDMYKVRTNWSNYAERIRPISDYPLEPSTDVDGSVGEAIDLGLSVKWASWNVGASAPENYGAFFAWGETEVHTWDYDWASYQWCNGDPEKLTKYCPSNMNRYWDGAGAPDGKTVFDLEDDAARAHWGGTWRMPTNAEWTELRNNCTWTWITQNGVNGRLVTASNGNSIFLPAAGCRDPYIYLSGVGSKGCYWSSSLSMNGPYFAWNVVFYSDSVYWDYTVSRCAGFSVRPVCD
jgi:hypothetical protein